MTNTSKLKKLQKVLGVRDDIFQLVPLQLVIAHISAEMCEEIAYLWFKLHKRQFIKPLK